MLSLTAQERAQLFPFLLQTIRCGDGDDTHTRSRRTWSEAVALHSDCLLEIMALAERLEAIANGDELATYFTQTEVLNAVAGSPQIARLAAEMACFELRAGRWVADGDGDGEEIEIIADLLAPSASKAA